VACNDLAMVSNKVVHSGLIPSVPGESLAWANSVRFRRTCEVIILLKDSFESYLSSSKQYLVINFLPSFMFVSFSSSFWIFIMQFQSIQSCIDTCMVTEQL
jgi:hypothetical protein